MYSETMVRIQKSIYSGTFDILLTQRNGDKISFAKPIEFELSENGFVSQPTLKLPLDNLSFFNSFFEESKHLGIVPETQVSNQEKEAINYHLEDMRKLVFGAKNTRIRK